MGRIIKWGILGLGKIADKFVSDLGLVEDALVLGVGSRDQAKAAAFAAAHRVERAYGSYEALVNDPDIDIVYIASPHSHHYEHAMLCLQHNKAVLCEKAFAINSRQAQAMIDLASAKNLFLMEALWTKFLPPYKKVMELIGDGAIGSVKNMLVNFGFVATTRNAARLTKATLGGGALLDIGVYNVFMVLSVLGRPDRVYATMTPSAEGVDEQSAVTFKYNNGTLAQLFSSFTTELANEAHIAGSDGRIKISNRFHSPSADVTLYKAGDVPEQQDIVREQGYGYQFEARHVVQCLQNGLTESPVITHADTLLLMETLDRIREAAGIVYESDKLETV